MIYNIILYRWKPAIRYNLLFIPNVTLYIYAIYVSSYTHFGVENNYRAYNIIIRAARVWRHGSSPRSSSGSFGYCAHPRNRFPPGFIVSYHIILKYVPKRLKLTRRKLIIIIISYYLFKTRACVSSIIIFVFYIVFVRK